MCGKFGHSAKECQNNITMANQDQTHNGPTNVQTIETIRDRIPISPTRLSILAQQIMADFQLSQEAWNKLNSQMNEMVETNKLLKKAVKSTYKKLSVPKQHPKKAPNNMKASKKTEKAVISVENTTKDNKDTNKTLKGRMLK